MNAINDHKLSDDKIQECHQIFQQFDKNKDGTISAKELSEALKLIGLYPNEEDLNKIIKDFDSDKSGVLEFPEFLQIVTLYINECSTEIELIEGLKILDRDQDGLILNEDLKFFMMNLGERLSEEEVDKILQELDPKNEGFIRYEDLFKNRSSTAK